MAFRHPLAESCAGMVWLCFFHPRLAGESGIERFFRHWGGEVLYNSHERDSITLPAIRIIGTPCVVEANIPIASLGKHAGLSFKIVRRFLKSRGFRTRELVIRRIVCFPEPDFWSSRAAPNGATHLMVGNETSTSQ